MRDEERKIVEPELPRLPDGHGIGWGRRLKTDSKKDNVTVWGALRDF
jgi:hypothetical protein